MTQIKSPIPESWIFGILWIMILDVIVTRWWCSAIRSFQKKPRKQEQTNLHFTRMSFWNLIENLIKSFLFLT